LNSADFLKQGNAVIARDVALLRSIESLPHAQGETDST
jgi:hypothetical protein